MKILFIGNIVGRPGRRATRQIVPLLRQRNGISTIVANGGNAAGGSGLTPETVRELFEAGVDVITPGDHLWDQKEVLDVLGREPRLLRPFNYPAGVPGQGSWVLEREGQAPVGVLKSPQRFDVSAGKPGLCSGGRDSSRRRRALWASAPSCNPAAGNCNATR